MRILTIVPQEFYLPRGNPLASFHQVRDLLDRGHEVEVLTYGLGAPPPDPRFVVHRARGPHFTKRLKTGPSYVKIWFDVLLCFTLIGLLMRRRYDLIWAHEEAGFIAAWVAPVFRVPFVYHLHSSLPLQIRDWGFSQWEWVVQIFRWVESFTLRRAAAAVVISPGVGEVARAAAPKTPVIVILNRFAVDQEGTPEDRRRIRAELNIADNEQLVLYTGTFVALQALDLLVEAVPEVVRRVPGARFALVGGRPAEIAALEQKAAQLRVQDAIRFVEMRPQEEMPAFMAACDVLVSPRVKGINPPGKLFSYLNSGRPVVATRTSVHTQFLNDACSILTPPTAAGLADGLVTALTDTARVRAVTQGAKEILVTEYSARVRDAAYDELLALMASRQPGVEGRTAATGS
jgi:glycosyltransferase involved in cell wall biosynthesis